MSVEGIVFVIRARDRMGVRVVGNLPAVFMSSLEKHPFQTFQPFHRFAPFKSLTEHGRFKVQGFKSSIGLHNCRYS